MKENNNNNILGWVCIIGLFLFATMIGYGTGKTEFNKRKVKYYKELQKQIAGLQIDNYKLTRQNEKLKRNESLAILNKEQQEKEKLSEWIKGYKEGVIKGCR